MNNHESENNQDSPSIGEMLPSSESLQEVSQNGQASHDLRGKIIELENSMLAMPECMTQEDFDTGHYFAPGLYLRQLTIPAGVVLTGKIHTTEHFCILSKGDVSVYTEDGIKRLKASSVVHSLPGTKRVLFAHEESIWINCHSNPTNETDLNKIDEIFVVDTYDQFLEYAEQKSLEEVK
jgi:hypothetical protein